MPENTLLEQLHVNLSEYPTPLLEADHFRFMLHFPAISCLTSPENRFMMDTYLN